MKPNISYYCDKDKYIVSYFCLPEPVIIYSKLTVVIVPHYHHHCWYSFIKDLLRLQLLRAGPDQGILFNTNRYLINPSVIQ